MPDAPTPQTALLALEDALVNEFRGYQALVHLTRDERRALSAGDLSRLMDIVRRKEALFSEIGQIERTRVSAAETCGRLSGIAPVNSIVELLPHLEPATAERLERLRTRILALVTELRELIHGNRALAAAGLERADSVRQFLVSLTQSAAGYQRPGAPRPAGADVALLEQWA
jgi:flagellar biosynthesis/type III secretory pathway chaperone